MVADAPSETLAVALADQAGPAAGPVAGELPLVVWTAHRLGPAGGVNAGARQSTGAVIVLLDPGLAPTGDVVTPLVRALDDPSLAVVGGWGSVSPTSAAGGLPRRVMSTRSTQRRWPSGARTSSPADRSTKGFGPPAISQRGGASSSETKARVRPHAGPVGWPICRWTHGRHRRILEPGAEAAARKAKRDAYRVLDRFGRRLDLRAGCGRARAPGPAVGRRRNRPSPVLPGRSRALERLTGYTPAMRRLGGRSRRSSSIGRLPVVLGALVLAAVGLLGGAASGVGSGSAAAAGKDEVTILNGKPAELDPALQGDIGSARVGAQLFESLTAIDPSLTVRPALAESWDVLDGGARIVFHLRPGLTFSDGSPLGAEDVVRSWLRIIDPKPAVAARLADGRRRGRHRLSTGQSSDRGVGRAARRGRQRRGPAQPTGDRLHLDRGRARRSPWCQPGIDPSRAALKPGAGFVGSGAYVLADSSDTELTLKANDRYWAGRPAIGTVHLLTTLAGKSPVQAFQDGDLDYSPIGGYDAQWIRYDHDLGPALRTVPSASVTYYGFDTSRPPFDDARVRQAFAWAVDWKRIVELGSAGAAIPATSMVPPGIPGRQRARLRPEPRPGRGAGGPGRGRLSGRRRASRMSRSSAGPATTRRSSPS